MAAVIAVGCAPATVEETDTPAAQPTARAMTADELAEQQAITDEFAVGFLAGDADATGALFTEDAAVLPQDMPMVSGRDEIAALFTQFPPLAGFEATIHEGILMGDTAVTRGTATLTVTVEGEDVVSHAKYMEVREKQEDGSWLIKWDIFNYDAPVPDTSEAE